MTADQWTLVGVGGYMLATLLLGIWAGRDMESGEDFMVAGRSMPRWLCTFTLFATWFGGGTCLGAAGKVYQHGLSGMIIDPLGAALCLVLSARFFFRAMRRHRFVTIGDFFRRRYGPAMETLVALAMVPAYVGWVASQLVAFSFVLHTLTGASVETGIVAAAVIVLVYTALGGMWAVAVTDFAQAIVLIIGLLVLLPVAWSAAGGWGEIVTRLPATHVAFLPSGGLGSWLWFLHAWVVIGLGDLPSQGLMSRAMSSEDDVAARQAGYAAAMLYLSVGLVPVTLGLLGVLLAPGLADPEQVLLAVAKAHLSPLLLALFAGALISALMSSADSALLAIASVVVENLVRPARGELSPSESLTACRVCVLVTAAFAMGLALKAQVVFKLMVAASAIGLVGMVAPFAAGLYWAPANAPGAVASLTAGMVSWVLLGGMAMSDPTPDHLPPDLVAAGISVLTLVIVSLATQQHSPPLPLPDPDEVGAEAQEA